MVHFEKKNQISIGLLSLIDLLPFFAKRRSIKGQIGVKECPRSLNPGKAIGMLSVLLLFI